MPNAVAFFPWLELEEPISVGQVRLLPYQRAKKPGDLPHVSQADLDGILAAYANRPNHIIDKATLLEFGDWHQGQDADAYISALFRCQEILAFSCMAGRKLFGHGHYGNFHTFSLTIQRFQPGYTGMFSFGTRRRDGGSSHMWSTDEFAFQRPHHVNSNDRLTIDKNLLAALLRADLDDHCPMEAIRDFNRANTDSPDVPEESELVMMKSAFEWLFAIGPRVHDLRQAISQSVSRGMWLREADGPVSKAWRRAWPHARSLMDAWVSEFCAFRGGAAHGMERGTQRFVWGISSHLAFASTLFPLLLKQRLMTQCFMEVDERATIELESVEALLESVPFAPEHFGYDVRHPWSTFYFETVLGELWRRRTAKAFADRMGRTE